MAVTVTANQSLATNKFKDVTANSTPTEIKTASSTLFAVEIDNSDNDDPSYFKIYNVAAAPTVGTTAPNYVIKVPAGAVYKRIIAGRHGVTFGTGIFIACVTAGGTAGSTAPTNAVKATLWTS